jgi:pyruvate/2-oxoglutarate dehydrogenase complex dihydrolipoamide acyltransferase (E2) component
MSGAAGNRRSRTDNRDAGEVAVVLEWNVTEGSDVTAGDVLVTLETAKATIDVEAPISGHVLRTFYSSGDEVGEHEVLAVLGEPAEQMPPDGSSAGPAADADDMGATSPAHATPAVMATQPACGGAEHDGHTQTPARRHSASPRARKLPASRQLERFDHVCNSARGVARHPEANSWFGWDGIKQFTHVNLGFAVDTGRALLVPVIRSADTMTLSELSQTARTAADKARAGTLAPEEMDGGTFTVSNLGSLGVHWFTPGAQSSANSHPGHRRHPPKSSSRTQPSAAVTDL